MSASADLVPEMCSQEPEPVTQEATVVPDAPESMTVGHEITINNTSQASDQGMDSLEQLFESSGNLSRAW